MTIGELVELLVRLDAPDASVFLDTGEELAGVEWNDIARIAMIVVRREPDEASRLLDSC